MTILDTSTIAAAIKYVLIHVQIPLDRCSGQCYDGCSTISGHKNGVAAIIKTDQPCALYTHCYGHSLNLATSDAVYPYERCAGYSVQNNL